MILNLILKGRLLKLIFLNALLIDFFKTLRLFSIDTDKEKDNTYITKLMERFSLPSPLASSLGSWAKGKL